MALQVEGTVLSFYFFGSVVIPFHALFFFFLYERDETSFSQTHGMFFSLMFVLFSQQTRNPGSTNIPVSETFHHFLDCTVPHSSSAAISLTATL
jgi:hypothetical protein